jgi:hypothetical protein
VEALSQPVTQALSLDDYEILSSLGQGGMARVSKARHRPTGEVVALKEMLPHIASSDAFVARFEREVRASASLEHPHIVRVQGFGVTPPAIFLALEFCDGGTLVDVLKRAPRLPPAAVTVWLAELLDALDAAHGRGIVHRDIKPANVLCTSTGAVKLSDFGIARLAGEETLTATGEVIGTPSYMSPEQALGQKDIDGRSDLYSLGMLAYRLLAGANPYQSENVASSLLRQTTGASLQTADALPACPLALEHVVDGLLQKDRERRWPSAKAALSALAPLLDDVRARMPQLGQRLVADPKATVQALFIDAAVLELRAAREALAQSPERAAIAAFRAHALAPEHPEASPLLEELTTHHGLRFGALDDPRIHAAEAELAQKPDAPATLRRLANLYRGHKHPVLAARYLKRFVALKPDDVVARQQLADLVGPQEATRVFTWSMMPNAPSSSPSSLRSEAARPPSTQDLVAGVKTGGMRVPASASMSPATSGTKSVSSPLGARGTSAFASSSPGDGPVVLAPERSVPWGWFALVGGALVFVAVSTVGSLVRSGQQKLEKDLTQVELSENGMMNGLVAETQRPLLERGEASLRVGDFQGAIEALNFALAADQGLSSPLSGRLFLRRAQAHDGLGNTKQALLDFRLAATRLAAGSPERTEAEASVRRLESVLPR